MIINLSICGLGLGMMMWPTTRLHQQEPEFIAKNLGGYPTYISFLSDGYESNIAKFMNCNTSYNSPPY